MSFKIVHLGSDWLSWLYIGQIWKCKGVICCSNIIICAVSKFNCSHMNNYKWIKDLEEKEYETTVSLLKGRTSWSIIATLIGRRAQLKAYLTLLHSTLLFFTGVAFFFFNFRQDLPPTERLWFALSWYWVYYSSMGPWNRTLNIAKLCLCWILPIVLCTAYCI